MPTLASTAISWQLLTGLAQEIAVGASGAAAAGGAGAAGSSVAGGIGFVPGIGIAVAGGLAIGTAASHWTGPWLKPLYEPIFDWAYDIPKPFEPKLKPDLKPKKKPKGDPETLREFCDRKRTECWHTWRQTTCPEKDDDRSNRTICDFCYDACIQWEEWSNIEDEKYGVIDCGSPERHVDF